MRDTLLIKIHTVITQPISLLPDAAAFAATKAPPTTHAAKSTLESCVTDRKHPGRTRPE